MFVDLEFSISLPEAATVPAEAIVESGLGKIVYVERGEGAFEPRRVETGGDSRVESRSSADFRPARRSSPRKRPARLAEPHAARDAGVHD
jgi:hypothetical protein